MAESLYPRFSDREYKRRDSLVKEMLREKNLDALLVYNQSMNVGNVSYLSNYAARSPSYLIYPLEGEPTLLLTFYNHIPCTKEMSIVSDVQWHYNDPVKSIVETLTKKKLDRSRIGIDSTRFISYSVMEGLKSRLPNATFVDVNKEYSWIRWVRSEEEIEWYKKSAHLTDLTMEALEKKIRPGLTEHDLDAIVHDAFLREGGQLWIDFVTKTSMANPDRFVPWQYPTARVLSRGDVVISEITVGYFGYTAQIHRPFAVGTEPTPLYKKLFDTAMACYENVSKVLKPGATTQDVLAATSVIEENGFTVYDSLVHGEQAKNPELGSRTSAHPKEDFTFRENMMMVIQPQPITRDYKAGLQLGAATIIRSNGAECLHKYPFKFSVCGS